MIKGSGEEAPYWLLFIYILDTRRVRHQAWISLNVTPYHIYHDVPVLRLQFGRLGLHRPLHDLSVDGQSSG